METYSFSVASFYTFPFGLNAMQHKLIKKMVSPDSMERQMQRYNFLGHRLVVGCIPYRYKGTHETSVVDEDAIEVLVITSQRKGKGMLFPKGGWEKDESIIEAVMRETLEEAGVVGELDCELGKWNFKGKNDDMCYEGYMFSLLVKEQLDFWPEKDVRQRKWVSVREARKVCQYWWMKEALEVFVNHIMSQGTDCETELCSLSQGTKSNL